jgi:hypothetical protein
MDSVAFRRDTQLLGANKDDWADIASFELIAVYHVNNGLGDLFLAVRHVHLEDLGAVKQAFNVLWEAENGSALGGFIGTDALKNAHSVVEAMG